MEGVNEEISLEQRETVQGPVTCTSTQQPFPLPPTLDFRFVGGNCFQHGRTPNYLCHVLSTFSEFYSNLLAKI